MRILSRFLERVNEKIVSIDEILNATYHLQDRNRRLFKLRDPGIDEDTHCATCGLPKAQHIPHDPPGVEKPEGAASVKDWAPYMQAQRKLYREALQQLADVELVSLPLPISKRRLLVLAEEVKDRLEKAPPGRYARIASDDDDL